MASLRQEIKALMAQRQALAVAISSVDRVKEATYAKKQLSRYVHFERQLLELKVILKDIEFAILDELIVESSEDEQRKALFYLVDLDQSGCISVDEIKDCLHKLGNLIVSDDVRYALLTFVTQKDDTPCAAAEKFNDFLSLLEEKLHCQLRHICGLFTRRIVFAEEGADILRRFLMNSRQNSGLGVVLKNIRIELLFEQLDWDLHQDLSFHYIAQLLLRVAAAMENIDQSSLIWFLASAKERLPRRHLAEDEFHRLLSGLYDLYEGQADLMEFCNQLTLLAARDYMLFASGKKVEDREFRPSGFVIDDGVFQSILNSSEHESIPIEVLECGKLDRLFDLFDVDQDDQLSLPEIVMVIRMFQNPVDMKLTRSVKQGRFVLGASEPQNSIGRIGFYNLINKCWLMVGDMMDADQFLDFIALQIVMREHSDAERDFINTFVQRSKGQSNGSRKAPKSGFFGSIGGRGERRECSAKEDSMRWHALEDEPSRQEQSKPDRSPSPAQHRSFSSSDTSFRAPWKKTESCTDDETVDTDNNNSFVCSGDNSVSVLSVTGDGQGRRSSFLDISARMLNFGRQKP